ncbi:TetR/AcrR family transcriptional regulator [Streptomyces zagrosensis]|uniref:AcrR family transcriptional regulator n=1 Tax=Streptomyces zagrosensis TaxID=1042984 RepID=A0A7W9UZE0_9ACTN|nr:TetR/AcrR family transcriptional regulator [Streptomyces zagrosensis]MBB5935684.1 AcrR family transcriptional regulator [Streptomyces zagrosensis]
MTVDRSQVLRAAATLLTRKATSSMDEIAKAAGISRATLHRHFAGRDALIKALEDLGLARFEAALDAADIDAGGAEEALRRLVAQIRPEAPLLAFLTTENQLFEGEMHQGWDRLDARMTGLFQRGQESGEFRVDLTATWFAEALYGLIGAGAWAVHAGRIAPNDMEQMIAELLLGGVRRSME